MVVLERGQMFSPGGNQYLQPDYLSPLPTTLDAKKSPLALLAQTCSQIGAESGSLGPTTKSTSSSSTNGYGGVGDKKSSSAKHQFIDADDSSPTGNSRSPSLSMSSAGAGGPDSGTSKNKRGSPSSSSSAVGSKTSPEGRASTNSSISRADSRSPDRPVSASTSTAPSSSSTSNPGQLCGGGVDAVGETRKTSSSPAGNAKPRSAFTASELSKSSDVGSKSKLATSADAVVTSSSTTISTSSASGHSVPPIIRSGVEVLQGQMSAHHHALSAAAAGYPFGTTNGLYGSSPNHGLGYPGALSHVPPGLGSPYGVDPASFLRSHPAAAAYYYPGLFGASSATPQSAALAAAAAAAAAYRPYLGLLGNPAAAKDLHQHHQLAGCRDPFCLGGCQLAAMSSASHVTSSIPSSVMTTAPSTAGGLRQPCLGPGCQHCDLHKPPPPPASSQPGSNGGSAAVTASAVGMPYVCNWIAGGDSYCGKRFATSEDLLTHLRTHTAAAAAAAAASTPDYSKLGSLVPPPPPGLGGGFSAQRTPMTPDLRFHPYSKSPGMIPGFPSPPAPPTSLAGFSSNQAAFAAAAAAAGMPPMATMAALHQSSQSAAAAAFAANPYYSPYSALYAAAAGRMGL